MIVIFAVNRIQNKRIPVRIRESKKINKVKFKY